MRSAGNDLVSFAAVNAERTKQPAFYKKILSATEIAQYGLFFAATIALERYVWLLWSVKEAAYKYLQRHQHNLVFSPTKFIVSNLKQAEIFADETILSPIEHIGFNDEIAWQCIVTYESHRLFARSIIYSNCLHSVVNNADNFNDIYWGVKQISASNAEAQSAAVRGFLLLQLRKLYPDKDLTVIKSQQGFPIIRNDHIELNLPVSFSHHGMFVAYSFYRAKAVVSLP